MNISIEVQQLRLELKEEQAALGRLLLNLPTRHFKIRLLIAEGLIMIWLQTTCDKEFKKVFWFLTGTME